MLRESAPTERTKVDIIMQMKIPLRTFSMCDCNRKCDEINLSIYLLINCCLKFMSFFIKECFSVFLHSALDVSYQCISLKYTMVHVCEIFIEDKQKYDIYELCRSKVLNQLNKRKGKNLSKENDPPKSSFDHPHIMNCQEC
jgi:hypothetical protein